MLLHLNLIFVRKLLPLCQFLLLTVLPVLLYMRPLAGSSLLSHDRV